ncbi:hypothetical protein E2562_008469 [Oryza meyeriana var. granulata]|uniref:Uncharacterized protein n=1 Tax=Oryza meyeriana var. granulata TaxID=110450 RepID=A0A6G1EHU9_9ORYZ|nr:hypothetical protein E2562_008469 [Oryza meyeriana var. granulata]
MAEMQIGRRRCQGGPDPKSYLSLIRAMMTSMATTTSTRTYWLLLHVTMVAASFGDMTAPEIAEALAL